MLSFSANLGFLFTEYILPDAVREASKAGFKAVEYHWPYSVPFVELQRALEECNIPVVGLNTLRGNIEQGDNGLAALPGRVEEARTAIDQAICYGSKIGARNVHVMAGKNLVSEEAERCYVENLIYAGKISGLNNMSILIEPLNPRDAPGYFLTTIEQAAEIIAKTRLDNIKIMFDCYHIQINQGDLLKRFEKHKSLIGHVQFASVPIRGEPDRGELDYSWLLPKFRDLGYQGFFGAEYYPQSQTVGHPTASGLGWMNKLLE